MLRGGCCRGARNSGVEAERLFDAVEPGGFAGEPGGGAHGAAREVVAHLGAVGELEALRLEG